jgi:hypothetical protein
MVLFKLFVKCVPGKSTFPTSKIFSDARLRYGFDQTFAFTARRFLPAEASPFISDFTHRHMITGLPVLTALQLALPSSLKLGEHSGLVLITGNGSLTTFHWSHPTRRPFTDVPLMQYPKCKTFRSYHRVKAQPEADSVTWVCRAPVGNDFCHETQAFTRRKEVEILKSEDRGFWEFRRVEPGSSLAGCLI